MADGYYLCIEAPTNDPPQSEDQDYILHVQFHAAGTGKEHYKVGLWRTWKVFDNRINERTFWTWLSPNADKIDV